jgi:hypothetical protein
LRIPHADHQRRHEFAAALISAPQAFAVDGDHARHRAKTKRLAQRRREGGESLGHFVGI